MNKFVRDTSPLVALYEDYGQTVEDLSNDLRLLFRSKEGYCIHLAALAVDIEWMCDATAFHDSFEHCVAALLELAGNIQLLIEEHRKSPLDTVINLLLVGQDDLLLTFRRHL